MAEGRFRRCARSLVKTVSKVRREDVSAAKIADITWGVDGPEESLKKIFASLTEKTKGAIRWYQRSRRPKRRGAICLRVSVIVLGTTAGLLPIFAQMFEAKLGKTPFQPAWPAVAVAVAGALLLLDRFFGCTSAWIRYIKAELRLQHLLEEFQLDWQAELAVKPRPPDDKKIQRLLDRAKVFLTQVNQTVQDETNTWIEEFKSTLKQIDEMIKAKEAATALAGLNVEVTDGDQFTDGWSLAINDGPPRPYRGKTAGLRNVIPGIHTVRIEGQKDGKDQVAEVTVSVPAGGIASVQVTLS